MIFSFILEYHWLSGFLLHSEEKWEPWYLWNGHHFNWLCFILDRWNFLHLFCYVISIFSFFFFDHCHQDLSRVDLFLIQTRVAFVLFFNFWFTVYILYLWESKEFYFRAIPIIYMKSVSQRVVNFRMRVNFTPIRSRPERSGMTPKWK